MNISKLFALIRVVPALFVLVMFAHVVMLEFGISTIIPEVVLGLIVFVLLMLISKKFHYCLLHRCCIIYGYAVFLCCHYERGVGFGEWLDCARLIALACGAFLILCCILRFIRCNKKNQNE